MLYDIYYQDGSFDRGTKLPARPADGTRYARNTNWDGECLHVDESGEWCDCSNPLHGSIKTGTRNA